MLPGCVPSPSQGWWEDGKRNLNSEHRCALCLEPGWCFYVLAQLAHTTVLGRNWGFGSLGDWPKVTQLVNAELGLVWLMVHNAKEKCYRIWKMWTNSVNPLMILELWSSGKSFRCLYAHSFLQGYYEFSCTPQKICLNSQSPVPLNMTLLGNGIFADIIKFKWGHFGFEQTLIQWLVSLLEEGNLNMDTETQREVGHVKTEAETEVMLPQTKECQGLSATTRS